MSGQDDRIRRAGATQPFAPLAGKVVVNLTTAVAGPYCTWILGALGADVIRVERPEGDDTRSWGPPFWHGESPFYLAMNSQKRSIAIDLKQPEGVEVLLRILERADVLVENLRPGSVERLGLGFDAVRAHSPRIVYCSLGAFGTSGPLRHQPGYDPLMQAAAGIMSITGEADGPPVRAGVSLVDQGTGLWAAIGVLGALLGRGDEAQRVDLSLYEVAINLLPYQLVGYLGSGILPQRQGSGIGSIAPYQAFETADGSVMIAAGNDRLFARLCDALDLGSIAAEARFATNADRVEHKTELAALIGARVARLATADALGLLERADVPAAPVSTLADVVEREQTRALGVLQPLPSPGFEDLVVVAPPLSVDGERLALTLAPPALGQHTRELLAEAGYEQAAIDALLARGTVRAEPSDDRPQ